MVLIIVPTRELVRVYSVGQKDKDVIDETFNKLHDQGRMERVVQPTKFSYRLRPEGAYCLLVPPSNLTSNLTSFLAHPGSGPSSSESLSITLRTSDIAPQQTKDNADHNLEIISRKAMNPQHTTSPEQAAPFMKKLNKD